MKETKKETFETFEDLKNALKKAEQSSELELNKFRAFMHSSLGLMPRTQLELVEFIERVMKHHGVIKHD